VEKLKPHYDLKTIQATFCEVGTLRLTRTATKCAEELGMSLTDVVLSIQGIVSTNFYKSMTAHADHRVWQDVYHVPPSGDGPLREVHDRLRRLPAPLLQGTLMASTKQSKIPANTYPECGAPMVY